MVAKLWRGAFGESPFQASELECLAAASRLFIGRFLSQIPRQINVVTAEDHAYDGTLNVASRFFRTPVSLSTGKVLANTSTRSRAHNAFLLL
jgi:hypothetical protein